MKHCHVMTELPFTAIRFYKQVSSQASPHPAPSRVHAIVKYKPTVIAPSLHDTMFYTIPVRDTTSYGIMQNSILAFVCDRQAQEYASKLNTNIAHSHANHLEPKDAECEVEAYPIGDLSYYAYNLGIPVVVIQNSYCEGSQREPQFEVLVS